MKLKNFIHLISPGTALLIRDYHNSSETVFVFTFAAKNYKDNYWVGKYGKAYKNSEVITCFAQGKDKLIVVVN